jgi:hypothetical protein
MPHCEINLYERVLAANTTSALEATLLVGNDLKNYLGRYELVIMSACVTSSKVR